MVELANAPVRIARVKRQRKGPWVIVRRVTVLAYLGLLVAWPVSLVFFDTFGDGLGPILETFKDPAVGNALRLTTTATIWAVVLNTVFGVGVSLLLVRYDFPGRRILNALIDLPMSVSPVVVGLALVIVYNVRTGWFGAPLAEAGIRVLFATPSIVLATAFVSLPLVIREVVPVLQEIGVEQEQAARSLGAGPLATFRRVTLPAIKWGLTYGVVLCLARSIGEFGAVKIVSGNVIGQSQTATLMVEQFYFDFDAEKAFAIASLLAGLSIITIIVVSVLRQRAERDTLREAS